MQYKKKGITTGILLFCVIAIHLYSSNHFRVEHGYSANIFPVISKFQRISFGFIPFSIGDILYGMAFIFLCFKIFSFGKFLFTLRKRENGSAGVKETTLSVVIICSSIYILFNILWGINYNRIGIAGQIGLKVEKYSLDELKTINRLLAEKINSSKQVLIQNKTVYPSRKGLFIMTANAYKNIEEEYPFLKYEHPSLKSSMWGWLGNYTGFLGFYNPFTGEAQVNTSVPAFTQPFTACHETAHQLGYAKEMEANFVGYLAAAASKDTLFRYSVYTDLFTYANRTLYFADSTAAIQYRKMLRPEVLADFLERRKFNKEHTSFAEPIIRDLYGRFLMVNQQPMGMLSYDEVTAFIISYYKNFGDI